MLACGYVGQETIERMVRLQWKETIMLKKYLIAMMLVAALVVVVPASTATAAPKSGAAVGVTPPDPDTTQIRIIDGHLKLSGHVVKAIGAELVGAEGARGSAACTSPFVSLLMPVSKGILLIKLMCHLVGTRMGLAILDGIKLMTTSPGTSPIGDNQCFQFRLDLEPVGPVIVNPSGSC